MFGSVSVIVPFNASEEYGDMNALKRAGLAHASNYTGAHTSKRAPFEAFKRLLLPREADLITRARTH